MRIWLLGALLLCVGGCDHLRTGGTYRLVPQPQSDRAAVRAVDANDRRALRQQVEDWLINRGFIEARSKGAAYWYKRGSHVSISDDPDGAIRLTFSALGGHGDVRLSLETEQSLTSYLASLSGLKIAPSPPTPR
jgi:hypothetical protein